MMLAASAKPLAPRISRSSLWPLVWSRVLATSSGVVRPWARAPAKPPARMWVEGE
jgi:hypothetical protein